MDPYMLDPSLGLSNDGSVNQPNETNNASASYQRPDQHNPQPMMANYPGRMDEPQPPEDAVAQGSIFEEFDLDAYLDPSAPDNGHQRQGGYAWSDIHFQDQSYQSSDASAPAQQPVAHLKPWMGPGMAVGLPHTTAAMKSSSAGPALPSSHFHPQPIPTSFHVRPLNPNPHPPPEYQLPLYNNAAPQPLLSPATANYASRDGGSVPDSRTGLYRGYAASEEEAKQLEARYLARYDTDAGNLAGFPQDDMGKCLLVREAVAAIMSVQGPNEGGPNDQGGRKNTAINRIKNHHWSDLELELMGWKLLAACKDAQLGKCRLPGWHSDRRLSERANYNTFAERWTDLMNLLKVSKQTVNSLFDASFVHRVAWNAHGEGRRKEVNRSGNMRKGEMLKKNRQASSTVEDDDGLDYEEANHPKRQRYF